MAILDPQVARYLDGLLPPLDGVRERLITETARMPEGKMQISRTQVAFLQWLAGMLRPLRILEIGTFTGLSTLTMAMAAPSAARITAVDRNREWTKTACRYWREAGIEDKIILIIGDALELLREAAAREGTASLGREGSCGAGLPAGPFDFIFLDADKKNYPAYFGLCLPLLAPEGVMVIDNTLWDGEVAGQPQSQESPPADGGEQAKADIAALMRRFNADLSVRADIEAVLLPVGDGMTLVRRAGS